MSRLADLTATVLGVGRLPGAPGTWGSLAALPFAWLLVRAGGPPLLAAAALAVFAAGCWAADACERHSGRHDPGSIVIDEVAGQWLTLLAAGLDLRLYAAGFVLFRFADIVKPWPVSLADRRVGGGLGVMLDDVLAAIYAGGALWLLAEWMR